MKDKCSLCNYLFRISFALLLLILSVTYRGIAQEISEEALRKHTYFLSHDLLEGRGTASHGSALAALYLTSRLQDLGLESITEDSSHYRIPVPLTSYQFDNSRTRLRIQSADSNHTLSPPDFYHPGGSPASFQDFGGKLLFAGSAADARSALEEYPDLTGYVVVLSPPWKDIGEVEAELMRRGAEGAIEVVPNAFYDRLRVVRGPTRFALPTEVDAPANQSPLPKVVIGPLGAKAMGVYQYIQSKQKTESAQLLQTRVDVEFAIRSQQKTGYNVAALLPGTDPGKSDNIVAYMAHYDHVGFGQPTKGDSLWNGFIDNSTGTSILLEIARVLSADPPAHSTLFLFTTAEEQGLLGATWFVHNSPIPLKRIKGIINIDGGAPPANVKQWTIAGSKEYKLRENAARALEANGWQVETKPIISDSDHWAFHRAGVPALFLYPGSQVTKEHIHTADDEWQADFPFEGLVHYGEAALQISRALEN